MARAAVQRRLSWQLAAVVDVLDETPRVRSLLLDCPAWAGHRAGQHLDIRLTAEDGYQAERSYSIASSPGDPRLVITVERLDDGEVSPYLTDEVRQGDQLELRGPIGGYFVWEPSVGGPLLLVAGGSGIVPFRSILRTRVQADSEAPTRLLYSVRSIDELIYRAELTQLNDAGDVDLRLTLTRLKPTDWDGYGRRVDRQMLEEVSWPPSDRPQVYICGPSGFVEAAANSLVALGHNPAAIRTERFGPTGVETGGSS